MPSRPKTFKPYQTATARHDTRASSTERGYDGRWRKARAGYLAKHPLCIMCERDGRLTEATVVDHIIPHRGDMVKFWDSSNWAPLCARCHNSTKQSFEKTGKVQRKIGLDGLPTA